MAKKTPAAPTTAATAALDRAGISFAVHGYEHDAKVTGYGAEAAQKLSIEAARVFKTLMVATDAPGGFGIGIVPVDAMLDLKALAAALGGKKAELADPKTAERKSGYVVGGISPIGQRTPLPTVLDASAQAFETILVSGGRRGFDLELAPADLLAVTGGKLAGIRRT
ncbi:Cys-tRNA(Pro) deacylase [Gryllotalpicola protaetiae]|uniref:Cys-tRNA(Pro)/Cys-tRNA(Cys) deacylase n=1 Tax=Gryllotalpicola protaetiae TaxID=2419771 RepID=A0A387BV29_9MICO|nr:Cys-tRNA(Pro) deacylase [Gryllotalpicola protaetiae]AYG04727.1 Cys-tRNA(Pro) deacylase [Gryllotalpicola protaetiae]